MREHEERWLQYAWTVVACSPAHARECAAAGGVGLPGDQEARFPGFVGKDYEPGVGVLCMGHVHRYLPDRDDIEGGRLAEIERAITTWRGSGRSAASDELFLTESRAAYGASAPNWAYWRRNYGPLLNEARLTIHDVAFANVAKCRTVTEDDSAASIRLTQLCARSFSPPDLVAVLQPAAVLLASLRLEVGDVHGAAIIRWNGRTGVDEEGSTMRNWLPFRAGQLRRLRG